MEDLNKKKLSELNEIYAGLEGAQEGKTFRKKAEVIDAIKRLTTPAVTVAGGGIVHRRKLFNWPARGSENIRPHRPGTKRDRAFQMLREGATFEEVMEACSWNETDAAQGIKLLHTALGYGLQEQLEGEQLVIRVLVPEGHAIQYLASKTATPPAEDMKKKVS